MHERNYGWTNENWIFYESLPLIENRRYIKLKSNFNCASSDNNSNISTVSFDTRKNSLISSIFKKLQKFSSSLKMQPLKLNQKLFTLVNLCTPSENITRFEVRLNVAVGIYVFVTLCLDLISSSFFVIQYKKRDLEDVLGSILQISAVSSNIFGMVTVFIYGNRLRGIFSRFQQIYDECKLDLKFLQEFKK